MDDQKALYDDLIKRGYHHLLPIIPRGARLSIGSALKEDNLGKVPGRQKPDGTWSGFGAWPGFDHSDADIEEWSEWEEHPVGVNGKFFPGIDGDVDDPGLMQEIDAVVFKHFPEAAVRSRDNSPRKLWSLKLSSADKLPGVQRVKYYIDGKYAGMVEILGPGHQYVLTGVHKSGAYQVLVGEPQEVTVEQIEAFIEALKQIEGFTEATKSGTRKRGVRAEREHGARSFYTMVETIERWSDASGRHDALRDIIWGEYQDTKSVVKTTLFAEMIMDRVSAEIKENDATWASYKADIPRLVRGAVDRSVYSDEAIQKAFAQLQPKDSGVADIDLSILPKEFAEYVTSFSDAAKVDPVVYVMALLGYLGGSLGNRLTIFETEGHTIHPSFGCLIAMLSGMRKSGAINPFINELKKVSRYVRWNWKGKSTTIKSHNNSLRARIKALEKEMLDGDVGDPAYKKRLSEIDALGRQFLSELEMPSVFYGSITDSKLNTELVNNDGWGIMSSADARKIIDMVLGEDVGEARNDKCLIHALSNDYLSNLTQSRGEEATDKKASMGVVLLAQHDKCVKFVSDLESQESGLIARVRVAFPRWRDQREAEDDPVFDLKMLDEFGNILLNLAKLVYGEIHLDKEAAKLRREFGNKWLERYQAGGDLERYSEILNKICSDAIRVAVILWAFVNHEKIANGVFNVFELSAEYVRMGIYLEEIFAEWKMRYIEIGQANRNVVFMDKILRKMHENNLEQAYNVPVSLGWLQGQIGNNPLLVTAIDTLVHMKVINESPAPRSTRWLLSDLGVEICAVKYKKEGKR